jgi:hypothetical protein
MHECTHMCTGCKHTTCMWTICAAAKAIIILFFGFGICQIFVFSQKFPTRKETGLFSWLMHVKQGSVLIAMHKWQRVMTQRQSCDFFYMLGAIVPGNPGVYRFIISNQTCILLATGAHNKICFNILSTLLLCKKEFGCTKHSVWFRNSYWNAAAGIYKVPVQSARQQISVILKFQPRQPKKN